MTADIRPSCGMFAYRDVRSAVTKIALVGSDGSFSVRLRKCIVSLMCDGRLLGKGLWVMLDERGSVGPSHPETIWRRGQFDLCIFGNPWKRGVHVFLGDSSNSMVVVSIMCWECI